MANKKIREHAAKEGVKLWEIAEQIGIAATTFSVRLRHELPAKEQARIIAAIDTIASNHGEERA